MAPVELCHCVRSEVCEDAPLIIDVADVFPIAESTIRELLLDAGSIYSLPFDVKLDPPRKFIDPAGPTYIIGVPEEFCHSVKFPFGITVAVPPET